MVAFDGRYSSRQFAEDTAAVLAGLGIPVHLFPDPAPTPLLSFSVPQLGAAAGVTVTASHNPPADNGYKVYLASGAQIVPPVDASIAAAIARAPRVDAIARPAPADAAARGLRRLVDVQDARRRGRVSRRPRAHQRSTRVRRTRRCASPTPRCTASGTASRSVPWRAPASQASP